MGRYYYKRRSYRPRKDESGCLGTVIVVVVALSIIYQLFLAFVAWVKNLFAKTVTAIGHAYTSCKHVIVHSFLFDKQFWIIAAVSVGIILIISTFVYSLIWYRKRQKIRAKLPVAQENLDRVKNSFQSIINIFEDDTQYLRSSQFAKIKLDLEKLLAQAGCAYNPVLKQEIAATTQAIHDFYNSAEERRDQINEQFFNKEKERAKNIFFDNKGKPYLTDEQLKAVLCDDDRNLIIAGAGSGKTRVIDFKVRYLVNFKKVDPKRLILLSFSRKSAGDLIKKISENVPGVDAKTIHSFAHQIAKSRDKQLFDERSGEQKLLVIKALVETLKEKSYYRVFDEFYKKYFTQIKPLIFYNSLSELREDLKKNNSKILPIGTDPFEEIKARRTFKTMKGHYVRSIDERYIADFLYLHDINYEYEKRYPYSKESYYPDFYLVDYDLYWEHFAITSNGQPPPYFRNPHKYLEGMTWKRDLHTENNTVMIESLSYLLNNGKSSAYLKKILVKAGVQINADEQDESAFKKISASFSKTFTKFYNTFKLSGLSLTDLKSNFRDIKYTLFLKLFERFLHHYTKLVEENNKMDFTDMIIGAIDKYNQGHTQNYDYIVVDEFQDTSNLAMALLDLTYQTNDSTSFLSVGDDWQSIYGFNGSDVTILSTYQDNYLGVEIQTLNNNFRSHSKIVDLGKQFISKNPSQIQKDVVSANTEIKDSTISFIFFKQMEALIAKIPDNESIFVLYRYNEDCPATQGVFENYFYLGTNKKPIKKKGCTKDISLMTIHGSKGLEARHVFILFPDGVNNKFPSEMEDHFVFNMLKRNADDFPFSEERRLMYVAITRAEQNLYFVSPHDKAPNSVFWDELKKLINHHS